MCICYGLTPNKCIPQVLTKIERFISFSLKYYIFDCIIINKNIIILLLNIKILLLIKIKRAVTKNVIKLNTRLSK